MLARQEYQYHVEANEAPLVHLDSQLGFLKVLALEYHGSSYLDSCLVVEDKEPNRLKPAYNFQQLQNGGSNSTGGLL